MATMLAVGYLIDKIDHRALLVTGMVITAGAFELMSQMPHDGSAIWLVGVSAVQGVGVGLLFTPLSTLAFSTLTAELRTDAAGVYSLLRQLGCATGVAVMTALLQAKIQHSVAALADQGPIGGGPSSRLQDIAIFAAYTGCFRTMAIITAVIIPGIFLFRVLRRDPALPTAVQTSGSSSGCWAPRSAKKTSMRAVLAPLAERPGRLFRDRHGC